MTERSPVYWATPRPMTDLGGHQSWVAELPTDVAGLRDVVSTMLVHPALASLYDIDVDAGRAAEVQLRPAAAIADAVLHRSTNGMAGSSRRATGVCRNFVVMFVAILRARGVPARARAGQAAYFQDARWIDHWIAEWWDVGTQGWVRTDAQLDDVQIEHLGIDFDPMSVPEEAFLTGGQCWRRIRDGSIDPASCGIPPDLWGPDMVRGNVVRDWAALARAELQPWDTWGVLDSHVPGSARKSGDEPALLSDHSDPDYRLFDQLALVGVDPDPSIVDGWSDDSRVAIPATVTSRHEGGAETVAVHV